MRDVRSGCFLDQSYLIHSKRGIGAVFSADFQKLRQVDVFRLLSGDRIFVQQTGQRFHILFCSFALGAFIDAGLQVFEPDIIEDIKIQGFKILFGCFVAVHGGFGYPPGISAFPFLIEIQKVEQPDLE